MITGQSRGDLSFAQAVIEAAEDISDMEPTGLT
jgi:hypothetical protein